MRVLNKRDNSDGIYIGRPTKFGNPFVIGKDGTREEVVAKFEQYILSNPALVAAAKRELRGKNLVCWCAPLACHGDILLKIANQMFDYPDLDTVSELGMRWYQTPAGSLPSITTVLGHTVSAEKSQSLQNWRESIGEAEADRVSKEATDHGTMVHLLIERFLNGHDVYAPVPGAEITDRDRTAFNSLKLKLKLIDSIWGQEQALYSPSLQVAGRFDCIGTYRGIPSVIDIKTSKRVKNHSDIADYALQVAFYALAHNELFGTDIKQGVILMAVDGGFPMEFVIDIDSPLVQRLNERVHMFWNEVIPAILKDIT